MVEGNLKLCCAFHFDLQCVVIQMDISTLSDYIQRVQELFQVVLSL